jgi:hypothetical protein
MYALLYMFLAPNICCRKAKLRKLHRPQLRFNLTEKLVQLRRLHVRPREHGVYLPAMINLVLEEMSERSRSCYKRRLTHALL